MSLKDRRRLAQLLTRWGDETGSRRSRIRAGRSINAEFPLHRNAALLGQVLNEEPLDLRPALLASGLLEMLAVSGEEAALEELCRFVANRLLDEALRQPSALLLINLIPSHRSARSAILEAIKAGFPRLESWAKNAARSRPRVPRSQLRRVLREYVEGQILDRL